MESGFLPGMTPWWGFFFSYTHRYMCLLLPKGALNAHIIATPRLFGNSPTGRGSTLGLTSALHSRQQHTTMMTWLALLKV
jgi:hypothetical protein